MPETPKPQPAQPPRHSTADPVGDGRLNAPAAVRNIVPIIEAMRPHIPEEGLALEIASGTGQHAVALAAAFPGLDWQPSDVEDARLASIEAWRVAEGARALRAPIRLDATREDWGVSPCALVCVSNLFHLISQKNAEKVIDGVARALRPGGKLFVYGPFRTGGAFRSEGDVRFHRALAAENPDMGYKDLEWLEARAAQAGLARRELVEMPANNLMLVCEKG